MSKEDLYADSGNCNHGGDGGSGGGGQAGGGGVSGEVANDERLFGVRSGQREGMKTFHQPAVAGPGRIMQRTGKGGDEGKGDGRPKLAAYPWRKGRRHASSTSSTQRLLSLLYPIFLST
ncbi:hypothetical protein BHM03_00031924 [Ensete ventricosum]|nr:hypothetical protein BHM03_00031924 [Ensete ventricosum]